MKLTSDYIDATIYCHHVTVQKQSWSQFTDALLAILFPRSLLSRPSEAYQVLYAIEKSVEPQPKELSDGNSMMGLLLDFF